MRQIGKYLYHFAIVDGDRQSSDKCWKHKRGVEKRCIKSDLVLSVMRENVGFSLVCKSRQRLCNDVCWGTLQKKERFGEVNVSCTDLYIFLSSCKCLCSMKTFSLHLTAGNVQLHVTCLFSTSNQVFRITMVKFFMLTSGWNWVKKFSFLRLTHTNQP